MIIFGRWDRKKKTFGKDIKPYKYKDKGQNCNLSQK